MRDAISSLISTLVSHPVAKKLRLRESGGTVARELSLILTKLVSDECDLQPFEPLTTLVAQEVPDPEIDLKIWKAVLNLLSSLSRITPPSSIPPTFGATPRTFTSASQQGSEQTVDLVEPLLREELRNRCYVKVEGFFQKYFETRTWSSISDRIIAAVGPNLNFPLVPTEDAVWNWVSEFQKEHLDPEQVRGVYYTTSSKKDLTGSEAERQLDLFVKSREAPSIFGQHYWGDVRVVGEHKSSPKKDKKFLQLARYAREVFAAQPTRLFVHSFSLLGTIIGLHIFDRSGAFSATEFDVFKEPERFIRVLTGYALMTDEDLGIDTFMGRQGTKKLATLLDDDLKTQEFEIRETPIARQSAIVPRATCCCYTADYKSVLKFAWQSPKRASEAEFLKAAHEIKGVVQLVASGEITTIKKLRAGLTFQKKRLFHPSLNKTRPSVPPSQSIPQREQAKGVYGRRATREEISVQQSGVWS